MRFTETNRILLREFGPVATLLEIGCAEGHHSLHLMQVCRQLYGLDVSPRAVRRARRRCPEAVFVAGDLTNVARFINAPQQFDVVVACEVLYYIEDVSGALKQMSGLGRQCLVTYFSSHREKLDRELGAIHTAGQETIRCDDHSWSVVWWRNY
jgi:predicted TPR repeat methyltransferase